MAKKDFFARIFSLQKQVRVGDIMTRRVISLEKDQPVYDAIKAMDKHSISTVITNHGRKPVGVITERDLVRKLLLKGRDPKKTSIDAIMSHSPKTVRPEASILSASKMMKNLKVRKLIVVNEKGEAIGIISQTDIINSMNKIYSTYKALLWDPRIALFLFILISVLYLINLLVFKL